MSSAQQAMDDPETRELFVESWPKKCPVCGLVYDDEQWERMRYVGLQKVPPEYGMPDMELRSCSCGNTLTLVVPSDFV